MQATAKDFVHDEERILWTERADVYYTANTIISRIVSLFTSLLCAILGIQTRGEITCTDRRLILILRSYNLWFLNHSTNYQIINLDHLAGVDVGDTPMIQLLIFFLFRKKVMTIYSPGRPTIQLAFRGNMSTEELLELLRKLSKTT